MDPDRVILVPATIEVTMPVKFAPLPLKLDDVKIPVTLALPTTKSADVGLVVPIPILDAVNTPTVEIPETDNEVTDVIPPITLVAIPALEA